jgi:transposase
MNFVQTRRAYYGGIDLHGKAMTVCIITDDGKIVTRKTIPNQFADFLSMIQPYKHTIAFAVEATFNWYWLVDNCRAHNIEIVLGHTFYMKLIYGGKNKNDKLDAYKIASILRAGLLPYAHACPANTRTVRDLLRHRHRLVYQRSTLLGQTKMTFYQYGHIDIMPHALKNKTTRQETVATMKDRHTRLISTINMDIVTQFDKHIATIEQQVLLHARTHNNDDLMLLLEVPGIGIIIALTILYEIDSIARFKTRQQFSSYCRLARPQHTSNGKCVGFANSKCGNSALKWAFMEIITNAPANSHVVKNVYDYLKRQYPPLKARAILANHFATVIYYMLKNKTSFDIDRFARSFPEVASQAPETGDHTMNKAA